MKFLILLLVIVVVGWLTVGRRRKHSEGSKPEGTPAAPAASKAAPQAAQPAQAMLACVHCGVHLPQAEAVLDAAGRPFCSEAHRLAGPR